MRTVPSLLPLFRSEHQGRLLALVLFDPGVEYSLAQLARRLGVDHATVSREIDRLETAGILSSRRLGSMRLVRAEPASPVAEEVRGLALKAFGPAYVLGDELEGIGGIREAWIYGSFAERAGGVPGPPPGDIDAMVVGDPDRNAVFRAAGAATERLGREVNVTVRSGHEWDDPADGFTVGVRQGPLVEIPLGARP